MRRRRGIALAGITVVRLLLAGVCHQTEARRIDGPPSANSRSGGVSTPLAHSDAVCLKGIAVLQQGVSSTSVWRKEMQVLNTRSPPVPALYRNLYVLHAHPHTGADLQLQQKRRFHIVRFGVYSLSPIKRTVYYILVVKKWSNNRLSVRIRPLFYGE